MWKLNRSNERGNARLSAHFVWFRGNLYFFISVNMEVLDYDSNVCEPLKNLKMFVINETKMINYYCWNVFACTVIISTIFEISESTPSTVYRVQNYFKLSPDTLKPPKFLSLKENLYFYDHRRHHRLRRFDPIKYHFCEWRLNFRKFPIFPPHWAHFEFTIEHSTRLNSAKWQDEIYANWQFFRIFLSSTDFGFRNIFECVFSIIDPGKSQSFLASIRAQRRRQSL